MDTIQEKNNNFVVLKLRGKLDAAAVNGLKNHIKSMIKESNTKIILDMGSVDFIDSSGLGCLVACFRSVVKVEGDMKISCLQDQVRSLFELTRLHRLFDIFEDSASAAKSFS